jgi:hypothetical protein
MAIRNRVAQWPDMFKHPCGVMFKVVADVGLWNPMSGDASLKRGLRKVGHGAHQLSHSDD